ncbi:MAG: MarC family protein [Arachnia sp.]
MSLWSAAVLLFLVMDPLGNIPLFVTAVAQVPAERRQRVILRDLLIALLVMVAFLAVGRGMLDVLHVTPAALNAAGGIVLMLIAIRMVFPTRDRSLQEDVPEPFIVPLAIPYTAGPSVLAAEILLMSQEPHRWPIWLAATFLAWFVSAAILFSSGYLYRVLGAKTLLAIERLMGMILVLVATQMLLTGIHDFFLG